MNDCMKVYNGSTRKQTKVIKPSKQTPPQENPNKNSKKATTQKQNCKSKQVHW